MGRAGSDEEGVHVRSILNKLGVNSRAQIATWMASADHR